MATGNACYPAEQVERLRLIKRLMDAGHRPGQADRDAHRGTECAGARDAQHRSPRFATPTPLTNSSELLALIKQHDGAAYQQAMQQRLARQGLQRFVQDTVAPLTRHVGEAWEEGSVEVFEEHLFTELTKRLLRQAIATLPGGKRRPRIVLTSVPDEPHVARPADGRSPASRWKAPSAFRSAPRCRCSKSAAPPRRIVPTSSPSPSRPPSRSARFPACCSSCACFCRPTSELWAGGGGVAPHRENG